MRFLLTSGGVTNPSIRDALEGLLRKPIRGANALLIPTAQWGHPQCGPVSVLGAAAGIPPWGGLVSLGWKSVGTLELTALPTIGENRWEPWVAEADALLVDGGDATYLQYWIQASGLAASLPRLHDTVWLGVSAGSMVMTPRIGRQFVEWSGASTDQTLGLVEFSLYPHLDVFPENTLADAEQWARDIDGPAYVIDDQTAVAVDEGDTTVISEGVWHQFDHGERIR